MQIEVQHDQEAVFRDTAGHVIGYWVPAVNGTRTHPHESSLDAEFRRLIRDYEKLRGRVQDLETRCSAQQEEIEVLSQILDAYVKGEISRTDDRGSLHKLIEELENKPK